MEHVGRTAVDNRQFINGVLWVLRAGSALTRSARTLWQVQSVQTRFMLGASRRVGAHLRGSSDGQEEPVSDDLLHHRTGAPVGGNGSQNELPRQGPGAFPRWTEHQGPSADRRSRAAGSLPDCAWTGCQIRSGDPSAGRATNRGRHRRQGLRLGRDRQCCARAFNEIQAPGLVATKMAARFVFSLDGGRATVPDSALPMTIFARKTAPLD